MGFTGKEYEAKKLEVVNALIAALNALGLEAKPGERGYGRNDVQTDTLTFFVTGVRSGGRDRWRSFDGVDRHTYTGFRITGDVYGAYIGGNKPWFGVADASEVASKLGKILPGLQDAAKGHAANEAHKAAQQDARKARHEAFKAALPESGLSATVQYSDIIVDLPSGLSVCVENNQDGVSIKMTHLTDPAQVMRILKAIKESA